MQYVIKSESYNLYYSVKLNSWGSLLNATKFSKYNLFRFVFKFWIERKYPTFQPIIFHRLVSLKANISLLGKIK